MFRIERTIEIASSLADVWRVVVDIERWPEWTASARRVERQGDGGFGLGSEARLWLKGVTASSVWRVTAYDEGRSFTWESSAPGLHSVGGHVLAASGAGTRVWLTVQQNGLMATLLRPYIAGISRRNVALEAEGLKRRCETSAAS